MSRIMGTDPALSTSTGTSSLISYDDTAAGFRNPKGDTISITSSPGTGASTAETWSHEVALEQLKQGQLEFEYQRQQNEIANRLAQAAEQRSIEEHNLSMQSMQKQMANDQAQLDLATADYMYKHGGQSPQYFTSGQSERDRIAKLGPQPYYGAGGQLRITLVLPMRR
jgi:hypothetical protein